ncbi:hypothetical protein ACFL0Z_02345 [Patescibacteria group bacterium]
MSTHIYQTDNQLEQQILSALAFYDMFDYPLTLLEIWKFLQTAKGGSGEVTYSLTEVMMAIDQSLNLEQKITEKNGFYMLKGREDLWEMRIGRHNVAQRRWQKLLRLVHWIADVPFLEMVAACNMFPLDTPSPASDIDIVIVAKQGRIWLVRLLVTVLIALTGQWRHKKVAGKLCLSFFIADNNLDLQKLYQEKKIWLEPDPYLVNWVALVAPIYDRHRTAAKFPHANNWTKAFIPNNFPYQVVDLRQVKAGLIAHGWQCFWEWAWGGRAGDKLEAFVRWWQMEYMKSRGDQEWLQNPNVIRSDEVLKFHEIDRREDFREEFFKKLAGII